MRLDRLLVEKGLVQSREKAQALIMAGSILVDGQQVLKPGVEAGLDSQITIKETRPFVSRAGVKLASALDYTGLDVTGLAVMDVGSSTGGFTDCLLKRGARMVYAIDVGKGLLDISLRNDGRVKVIEGRNIRYLDLDEVGEKVDLAVIDVSFISLEKVIPKVRGFLKEGEKVLALIKPQFEADKGNVGKGGIVRDPLEHSAVVERIKGFCKGIGLKPVSTFESAIKGIKG
ncbi:MAG: TlyA family RNA methyltransferase, partial [Deltaproteobacteria bacterium]|nr:TlyA family RNA methyltransferase [Deltaproteobacteria bacterium]